MALLTNINGKFSVSDAGAVTFNNAFTFPTADGSANYVLQTNGSGQIAWAENGNGDITGSGTANTVTKFTGAKAIGNGPITFSGTGSVNSTFAGDITLGDDLNFTTNGFADISNTGTGAMRFKPSGQTLALTLTGANATFAGTVTGTTATFTTFFGDLNGTINTATTAVTQPNATDNTKVATTAYVVNKIAELPAGLIFLGTWNADTNTPTLASGGGERSEGTTTTVTANKLIDSAATFTTAPAVVVGDRVRVVTPAGPEFALVTSVDSATQLTLAANIVTAIGEAYILEVSPFIPEGNYYIVSTDGATDLNGITDWKVGDWVVASSTNVWQKIDNSSVLDGTGTGQKVTKWDGSGDSNTLTNGPITFATNNSTFAGNVTTGGQVTVPAGYSVNIGTSRIHSTATSYLLGGNVGIGTDTPTQGKVDILDAGAYSAHTGHGLTINSNASNAYTSMYMGADDSIDAAYIQSAGRNTSFTSKKLLLNPNGGNVGIGTTGPGAKLQVYSAASTNVFITGYGTSAQNDWGAQNAMFVKTDNGLVISKQNAQNNTNRLYTFYNDASGNAEQYIHNTSNTATIKLDSAGDSYFNGGNVGIGTDAPGAKLEVLADVAKGVLINRTYTTSSQSLANVRAYYGLAITPLRGGTGGLYFTNYDADTPIIQSVNTSDVAQFLLLNPLGGNVGIGTTSPGEKLEISGNSITRSKTRGLGTNYATSEGWVAGAASSFTSRVGYFGGNFTNNGPSAENKVEYDIGPFGSRELVWMSIAETGNDDDGGWNKSLDGFNNSANNGFMSIVYVRRDAGTAAGNFYHGCSGSNTLNLDGTTNTNPYFNATGISVLPADVWCVAIGIIYATNDTTTTSSALGGIYRLDTGQKVEIAFSFRQQTSNANQSQRVYHYYSTSPSAQLDFANPGFYILDGSEPSLGEILGSGSADDVFWSANGSDIYNDNTGNVGIGMTTPNAPLDVLSLTSGSSGIQQWSYNTGPSSYRLQLNQIVSSGLVKYSFDQLNAGAGYNNVIVLDRGNVGIGTTSPVEKLDTPNIAIGGSTITGYTANKLRIDNNGGTSRFYSTGANTTTKGAYVFHITSSDGSLNPEIIRIASDGNVGIGTSTPSTKLEIFGNNSARNTLQNILSINGGTSSNNVYSGFGMGLNFNGRDYSNEPRDYAYIYGVQETSSTSTPGGDPGFTSQLRFYTNTGGAANTLPTQKMTIYASGNVETTGNLIINKFSNTAPYADGEIRFTGRYDRYVGGIKTFTDNASYPEYANGLDFFVQRHVYALPNGHLAMRIDSDGNVGIGTDSPESLLHIKGETRAYISFQDTTDGYFGFVGDAANMLTSGTVDNLGLRGEAGIQFGVSDVIKMVLDSSGNLGIGTDNPGGKLEIEDTTSRLGTTASLIVEGRQDGAANVLTLRSKDYSAPTVAIGANHGAIMRWQGFDGTDFENMGYIFVGADGQSVANGDAPSYMTFGTSADGSSTPSERLRIDSEGNVGIGYTDPQYKLDVNGQIRASGIVNIGGLGVAASGALANVDINDIDVNGTSTTYQSNITFKATGTVKAQMGKLSGSTNVFTAAKNFDGPVNIIANDVHSGHTHVAEYVFGYEPANNQTTWGLNLVDNSTTSNSLYISAEGLSNNSSIFFGGYTNALLVTRISLHQTLGTWLYDCPDAGTSNVSVKWRKYNTAGYMANMIDFENDGDIKNINGSYGTISSDERVKENIVDATSKLDDILSLKVKNFNFIGDDKKQIGLIAQEVEEVFPSWVNTRDTRIYKTHDEEGLPLKEQGELVSGHEDGKSLKVGMEFAILTKAIQEQQEIIENLKIRIEQLEN